MQKILASRGPSTHEFGFLSRIIASKQSMNAWRCEQRTPVSQVFEPGQDGPDGRPPKKAILDQFSGMKNACLRAQ
jgi:hypothetical protein